MGSVGSLGVLSSSIWLVLAMLLSLAAPAPVRSSADNPTNVFDTAGFLHTTYRNDLESRLRRFEEVTGQAILIAITDDDVNQSLVGIANELFEKNELELRGTTGSLFLMISVRDRNAAIAVSKNLRQRFSRSGIEDRIRRIISVDRQSKDVAMEYVIQALLAGLGHWFYRFDPPAPVFGGAFDFIRVPSAEIIILVGAPFVGTMTGFCLMVFSGLGGFSWGARMFVSALSGAISALALTFIARQPIGIQPGMFYFGLSTGALMGGVVGGLRSYWFPDSYQGKKTKGWWSGPVYFRNG